MSYDMFVKNGKILMLALDHRGSLEKMVPKDSIIDFKQMLLESLSPLYSGVLLDPTYGLPAYNRSALPSVKEKPYLLCIEKTGYEDVGRERLTKLEHSVGELKNLGAKGIKLLLFYHPDAKTAGQQIAVAQKVCEDSRKNDLPFFLEILNYSLDSAPYDASKLVHLSVKNFLTNGITADVFKLEFPGTAEACREVTKLLGATPWILLTKGASYESFVAGLKVATKNGARGFLAGRSIWQDFVKRPRQQWKEHIGTKVKDRFEQICSIALNS